jgi:hypothetical protein
VLIFLPFYALSNSITVHQGGASSRSLATIHIRGLCTVSFFKPTTPVPMRVYSNIAKKVVISCVC